MTVNLRIDKTVKSNKRLWQKIIFRSEKNLRLFSITNYERMPNLVQQLELVWKDDDDYLAHYLEMRESDTAHVQPRVMIVVKQQI